MEKIMGLGGKSNPLSHKEETQVEVFLLVWIFINAEVVDIKFGFVQQHRPSPNGEG